jgi:hypothetical protein
LLLYLIKKTCLLLWDPNDECFPLDIISLYYNLIRQSGYKKKGMLGSYNCFPNNKSSQWQVKLGNAWWNIVVDISVTQIGKLYALYFLEKIFQNCLVLFVVFR